MQEKTLLEFLGLLINKTDMYCIKNDDEYAIYRIMSDKTEFKIPIVAVNAVMKYRMIVEADTRKMIAKKILGYSATLD